MREKNLTFRTHNPILSIVLPGLPALFVTLFLVILLFLSAVLSATNGHAAVIYARGIQILQPRYSINAVGLTTAPQEILIKFKQGVVNNQILAVYTRYQLQEISFSPYSGIRRCYILAQIPVIQIINMLRTEPSVLYAEPNLFGYTHFIPNDPFFTYQWHLPMMKATAVWDVTIGSGVVVAVLDTGVAFETFGVYGQAPDLAGTSFVAGYDFVNDDPNPDDDEGHGTHISGTIAQSTGNALGCAGAAFGATIMPVKVMDNTGSGTLTDIVDGIYYAANNGAKIINMSLGFGDNPSVALEDAVNYAYNNGCLLVCSAGNNGTNTPNYPGSYPVCISVSAVRYDLTLGSYSNYGLDVDICAPGGDLNVDQNLDSYPDGILQQTHDGTNFKNFGFYMGRGTSWAAANVSSVAALVLSASGGTLATADLRSILETTARDLGTAGWDQYYGWGMVDAYAAVNAAVAATATAQILGARIPVSPRLASVATPQQVYPLISGNSLASYQLAQTQNAWAQMPQAQNAWAQSALSQNAYLLNAYSQPNQNAITISWNSPLRGSGVYSLTGGQSAASPSQTTAQINGLTDRLFPLSTVPAIGLYAANSLGTYNSAYNNIYNSTYNNSYNNGLFTLNSINSQLLNPANSQFLNSANSQLRSSSANQPWGTQQSIQGIFPSLFLLSDYLTPSCYLI